MEFVTQDGYYRVTDGGKWVMIHRLVAVAEFGFDAVAPDVDIHHKDGSTFNNSPDNLEPLPQGEHKKRHLEQEHGDATHRDEDTLRELYVDAGMSLHEVADVLDCSFETVRTWLEKHGIERADEGGNAKDADYKDADTLRRLYVDEGLSTYDLADRFGVDTSTVIRHLRKHDIKVRPPNR